MIRHEDEQINRRLTWFGTVQGLLMAALAFAWEKAAALVFVLAPLGIAIAFSTFYAVRAGLIAIEAQRDWWDMNRDPEYFGPDVIGRRPDDRSIPWMRPYRILPLGFGLSWLAMFLIFLLRALGILA